MDKTLGKMNVVCSFDNGYSPYAGAMLTSLFENNKNCEITVYVLTDCLDNTNRQKLNSLAKKYLQEIIVKFLNKEMFEGLPSGGKFPNISLATYYRLLIDTILPQNVERVLYLDCDIIVNGNLKELYDMKFNHRWQIVALKDRPDVAQAAFKRLELKHHNIYVNAGVMLLNIPELRSINFSQRAFDYLSSNLDKVLFHDQDVINAILTEKEVLPLKYNVLDCALMKSPIIADCYISQLTIAIYNPIVIHYSGARKPWHTECNHPYKYLFEEYLELSPWHGTPSTRRYESLSARFLFKIKELVKYLLLFIGNGQYIYLTIQKKSFA